MFTLGSGVRFRALLVVPSVAILLGAAPASWPMYQYSPTHNAVFASAEPAYSWHVQARGQINGGLAVVGNTLYYDDFARELVAVDRRSGRTLWRAPLRNIAMTTPIVADGVVIVGTGRDNTLVDSGRRLIWGVPSGDEIDAFDAGSGRVRWRYHTVGEDMPSAALISAGGRDLVLFANGDGHARALDAGSGHLVWGVRIDGVSTMASAVAENGTVYVVAGPSAEMHRPDHVYALRASDGEMLWSAPYGNADASPAVADGRVFVEDAQFVTGPPSADAINDVYAVDATTGHLTWARNSGVGNFTRVGSNEEAIAAMFDRGVLFQSLPAARRFAAYDAQQGRSLWTVPTQAAVKMSGVAIDGRVYVGDTAGVLSTIDEGSGRVIARRQFSEPFSCSSPVIVGSTLYVADGDELYALPLQ